MNKLMPQEDASPSAQGTRVLDETIRPAVALTRIYRGGWVFAGLALVAAIVLFESLESRRASRETSTTKQEREANTAFIAAPPELAIPPTSDRVYELGAGQGYFVNLPQKGFVGIQRPLPQVLTRPIDNRAQRALPAFSSSYQPPQRPEPAFDPVRTSPAPVAVPPSDSDQGKSGERVRATRFANPASTIPKGTVMQAVLESALDSARAGMARAIISKDVYSFDGTQVLVPRGSRLIGEYKADLAVGQKRALIQWQRLMRPDGMMINLDSPSADPLGRAGVKGKVNSHFIDRFGGAILQSALDIGVQAAANRIAGGSTIYAVPGLYALSGAAQGTRLETEKVQPTLTVAPGSSVSVFVARDLDFSVVQP